MRSEMYSSWVWSNKQCDVWWERRWETREKKKKKSESRLVTTLVNMHWWFQPPRSWLWIFLQWEKTDGHNVPSVCVYVGCHMEIHAFQPNFLLSLCSPTHVPSLQPMEKIMEKLFSYLQNAACDVLVRKGRCCIDMTGGRLGCSTLFQAKLCLVITRWIKITGLGRLHLALFKVGS